MNTTETPKAATPTRRVLRRIGAVLAGLLAIFILSTATDVALHATGVFPLGRAMSDALFLLALVYRIVYASRAATSRRGSRPIDPCSMLWRSAPWALSSGIAGAVAMWDAGPAWYSLGVIAIAMPCAWAGGKLGAQGLRGTRDQRKSRY